MQETFADKVEDAIYAIAAVVVQVVLVLFALFITVGLEAIWIAYAILMPSWGMAAVALFWAAFVAAICFLSWKEDRDAEHVRKLMQDLD